MHHDVVDTALTAFSRVQVGRSLPTVAGLHATPLLGPMPHPLRATLQAAAELSWSEADPPNPRWLRVSNATAVAVTVPAGTVLAGGMSARTVGTATVVGPRGSADVSVEPLAARWWDEGKPHWHGRLGPVAAALLLQARLAEGGVASSARTAMWTLSLRDLVASQDIWGLHEATQGWVLTDETGVLAGWLSKAPGAAPLTAVGHDEPRMGLGHGEPHALADIVESLRSGIDGGMLIAHVLDHVQLDLEVAVLPRGYELVDRVVAAMNRDRSTRPGGCKNV
jgi:hypothetical protein